MALKIDWNLATYDAIRRDPVLRSELRAAGDRVAARCGPGFEVSEYEGRSRSRVHVITATAEAKRENARRGLLARARDAA